MSKEDEEALHRLDIIDLAHAQAAFFTTISMQLQLSGILKVADIRSGLIDYREKVDIPAARALLNMQIEALAPDQERFQPILRIVQNTDDEA